jgi:hypothetical protein
VSSEIVILNEVKNPEGLVNSLEKKQVNNLSTIEILRFAQDDNFPFSTGREGVGDE